MELYVLLRCLDGCCLNIQACKRYNALKRMDITTTFTGQAKPVKPLYALHLNQGKMFNVSVIPSNLTLSHMGYGIIGIQ